MDIGPKSYYLSWLFYSISESFGKEHQVIFIPFHIIIGSSDQGFMKSIYEAAFTDYW